MVQGSKSMAKRQREEAEHNKSDRAAKKLRLQMRQRGHLVHPRAYTAMGSFNCAY